MNPEQAVKMVEFALNRAPLNSAEAFALNVAMEVLRNLAVEHKRREAAAY